MGVRRTEATKEGRKEGENWRRRKEGVTTSPTRGDFSSTLYPYPPPSLLLLKDRGGGGDVGGREGERVRGGEMDGWMEEAVQRPARGARGDEFCHAKD